MSLTWGRMGVSMVALAALSATAICDAAMAAGPKGSMPDLSGIWLNTGGTNSLKPIDAEQPPLNAAGLAAYSQARADLKSGKAIDAVHKYCLPRGVPLTMASPYPLRIIQGERQLTMIHESHHTYRIVLIGDKHPSPDEASTTFMGDSVGGWSGKTFVIDTVQFNTVTPLDSTGLPHGERLHVIEKITKSSDGRELVDLITIEDPEFYSRPWTVKMSYRLRPDLTIEEYVCGEPHRDLSKLGNR
jgi:hypothetical protein